MADKNTFISTFDPLLPKKLNALSKSVEEAGKPFIVNLTLDPEISTNELMQGTMDKTTSELLAAHNAGKRIMFSLAIEGMGTETFTCTEVASTVNGDYPSFNSVFITRNPLTSDKDTLIWFATGITDNPDNNEWFSSLYPLGE